MSEVRKSKGSSERWLIMGAASVSVFAFAAWLTHVITCFSDDRWGFLIAGALFFPVAVVHGIGLWFGVW